MADAGVADAEIAVAEIVDAEIAGTEMPETGIAGTEIADVEVEEVSSVAVTHVTRATEPTARSTGVWQFPDDFLDGDTPPTDTPEAAPVQTDVATRPPAAASRVRQKPPKNSGERLLGVLIALALVILVLLGACLFFLVSPQSYAAFRAKLPAGWTFLPPAEGRNRQANPPAGE